MKLTMNAGQEEAISKMLSFLKSDSPHFLLEGGAGTGKTSCIQSFAARARGKFLYTAPTNKATKVLRDSLTELDHKPECRTIYSALGLRIEPDGEVKVLTEPEDPLGLSTYTAIIVDEASMVNSALFSFIDATSHEQGVKFIFLGDEAQLPPVGEASSEVWKLQASANSARLTEVMRFDNQILTLAGLLREKTSLPFPQFSPKSDNDGEEGVWVCSSAEIIKRITEAAEAGEFSAPGKARAIAWRNQIVDQFNLAIRRKIFGLGPNTALPNFLPDDRVILTEPAKDLDGNIIATTDEEGKVVRSEVSEHPVWKEFQVYNLTVMSDRNETFALKVLHENSLQAWNKKREELASVARANRRLWGDFWEFKEAFHSCRPSYAITAHRAQGSTYETAFVNWRDILLNRNRQEAFRCLYVAATRAKKRLFLN